MHDFQRLVDRIVGLRRRVSLRRAVLVAITGIDASGKGYCAARVDALLAERGLRTALLNVDGWLELPHRRFSAVDPARHFYACALRFDAMFATLVLPLRDTRSIRVDVEHADETASAYRARRYEYDDLDVIVLEGIFLLKRQLVGFYDLSVWIDCTFETALERAIARAQEGLSATETADAYRRVYFPAQRLHLELDEPRAAACVVVRNDPRLRIRGPAGPRLDAVGGAAAE